MIDLFPEALSREIGIGNIIPLIRATRSMKINPWIFHPRAAATITKTDSDYQFLIQKGVRKPKLSEIKILGSFPCEFDASWKIIGNSVPPLLMKAIATQIRHKLWRGDSLTRYPKTMTYPEILEVAWQDHLTPRAPDAPTVISTFAGGGGSSLGYSMAGYRELLAIEWDDNAVTIFKLNFPGVPVYHGDIAKLSVDECMRLAEVKEGELDLLDGSPPCQGVSTAGKRNLNDPRNQLFREFVRLLRGLKPKVFVMENVPGLVKGKMKLIFAEIMRELKASGYQVRCKKLNAMYFYVPQSRERLIFIGVRNDLGMAASHPKAESRPIAVREAFGDLSKFSKDDLWWQGKKGKEIVSHMHQGEDGVSVFQRLEKTKKRRWFNLRRLAYNKPSWIIVKGEGASHLIHPTEDRILGLPEYARISSFPDSFILANKVYCKPIFGNSVPPLLMRSIAVHIKTHILDNKSNHYIS